MCSPARRGVHRHAPAQAGRNPKAQHPRCTWWRALVLGNDAGILSQTRPSWDVDHPKCALRPSPQKMACLGLEGWVLQESHPASARGVQENRRTAAKQTGRCPCLPGTTGWWCGVGLLRALRAQHMWHGGRATLLREDGRGMPGCQARASRVPAQNGFGQHSKKATVQVPAPISAAPAIALA